MTTANEQSEKQQQKEALKARSADMEKREKELNASKTGKGTRTFLGLTRGRNPQEIQYEAFDDSLPDTLPTDLDSFMKLSGVEDEKTIVSYLIEGYNAKSYETASDPVAEFVDSAWPEDVQKSFRLVIRQYAQNTGNSIDDAVKLIKPGFVAAMEKAAAEKTATEKPA